MSRIKLAVVENPDPTTSTIFVLATGKPPIVRGEGGADYYCPGPGCKTTLLRQVRAEQVLQTVFKCPKCATHCEVPKPLRDH